MTVDEVKILLSDLNRGYNTPYSSAEQATIERLYYEVLGKRLSGCRCPDRWHDAVLEINSYIKKHGKMKEKSNYKLRAGVILQIAGSSEIYTNDNLTDEVAAAFLKEHPNAAGRIIDPLLDGEFFVIWQNRHKNLRATNEAERGASAYQIAGLFNGLTLSAGSCEKYSDDTLSGWAITLKEEKAPRSAMFLNAGSLAATEALIKTMLTPSETE